MPDDRAARVHAAYVHALRTVGALAPGGEVTAVGPFVCIDAGLGVSRFNIVVAEGPVRDPRRELRASLNWFAERGLNARVDLRSSLDGAVMAAAMVEGLQFWRREPAMLLEPLPGGDWTGKLALEVVDGEAGLERYCAVDSEELGDVELERGIAERAMAQPGVSLLVGSFAGKPVARAMAIRVDDLVSIHNVYVGPRWRKRGFGAEISRAAIDAGREQGATAACLEATAAGLSIYVALGFQKLDEYVVMGTDEPIDWR